MTKKVHLRGGCLCGATKFETEALPFDADYCHCSMCRKSTGAPFAAWMDFKRDQVVWVKGMPTEYSSSHFSFRGFCSKCGTSLSFRDDRAPEYYSLAIAALDDPNLISPKYHIHTDSQPKWLKIDDDLPRYPASRSAASRNT